MGLPNPFRRKDDDFSAQMMREASAARPTPQAARVPAAGLGTGAPSTGAVARGALTSADRTAAERAQGAVDARGLGGSGSASDEDVRALVQEGKLIEAVKQYRALHGVGLKEAKDAVDEMRA